MVEIFQGNLSAAGVSMLWEIFYRFLRLGCIAFGGPVAHLGFLENEFVQKRGWLSAAQYADLVALCQFLPGPASSQVGFAIGCLRGGRWGGLAAWLGFTLPSAVLMLAFAWGLTWWRPEDLPSAAWLMGLQCAAAAVVAQAVISLFAKLCQTWATAAICLASAAVVLLVEGSWVPVLVIAVCGGLSVFWRRPAELEGSPSAAVRAAQAVGWPYLLMCLMLLLLLPILALWGGDPIYALLDAYYHAGAWVFGGGHVVLPLLDRLVVQPGWLDSHSFLAGYGAAQALPGPLFAFSAFVGSRVVVGPGGVLGGVLALVVIYLPSWLLVWGALPYWQRWQHNGAFRAALRGANAAVVGILLAACYQPVGVSAILSVSHAGFVLVVWLLLRTQRVPVWTLVLLSALVGAWVF